MPSRPQAWWCDPFWSHFKGRPFDVTQGASDTTLASTAAQDATSISVASATGFVVGEIIALGSGTNWQSFTLAGISGTTFTIYPRVKTGGFASGQNVIHAWNQNAHPNTANAYAAYAQTLADMPMRRAIAGTSRLGTVGDMASRYTDARAVANVPTGWESLGTATFTAASFSSADVLPHSRSDGGIRINAAAVNDGMRTLSAIAVTPGESLFVAAFCKHTAGTGFTIKVVDKSSPSTVLGQLAAVMGDRTNFNFQSMAQVHVPFQVPVGVTSIEIRVLSTGTTDECYVDDVRVLVDRQAPSEDRFLFEDPGAATVAWMGDSWAIGATSGAEKFRAALEARFGHSITWLNAGVTGDRLDNMVIRFDADIVPSHPKLLVIQYGANDISQSRAQGLMEGDADQMLEKCRRNGIIPVFAAIPPITSFVDLAQQRTEQVRARVSLETPVSDFRQMTLGAPLPLGTNSAAYTNFSFVNTTDQVEWVFVVADDKGANTITITQLGYRLNAVTGVSPLMKISLQGVDASGNPDGTIKGGASPASATFTPSGGAAWAWVTLANAYVATRGEELAIVVAYNSGTLNGSNFPAITSSLWSASQPHTPYAIHNVAGVRTRQTFYPNFGFASASRSFGMPTSAIMLTQKLSPTQTALRFILDSAFVSSYKLAAVRFDCQVQNTGGTCKVSLYDGTTLLQQATLNYNKIRGVAAFGHALIWFPDNPLATLLGGKEYRVALEPQDGALYMVWHALKVLNASDLEAFPGGSSWYSSNRATGGATAWTDVTTERPIAELIISDWQAPSPGVIMAVG